MTNQTYNEDDLQHCRDLVRLYCEDQYLATLLLSDDIRDDIFVLFAFHGVIIEAISIVNEPMAGEIRLQWWCDVINGERENEAAGNPVARALLTLIKTKNLPRKLFEAKLRAHVFELYQNPMQNIQMLEGFCGETRSYLFQIAALVNGAPADQALAEACGYAGMADGLTMVLTNLARHRANGQVYIPEDMLAEHNLSVSTYFDVPDSRHEELAKSLIKKAKMHLDQAKSAIGELERSHRATFRILGLVPLYLSVCRKDLRAVFTGIRTPLQMRRQWRLYRSPIR